jgi:hypothetical protein
MITTDTFLEIKLERFTCDAAHQCNFTYVMNPKPSPILTLASVPHDNACWEPFSGQEGSETGLGILRFST